MRKMFYGCYHLTSISEYTKEKIQESTIKESIPDESETTKLEIPIDINNTDLNSDIYEGNTNSTCFYNECNGTFS